MCLAIVSDSQPTPTRIGFCDYVRSTEQVSELDGRRTEEQKKATQFLILDPSSEGHFSAERILSTLVDFTVLHSLLIPDAGQDAAPEVQESRINGTE